MEHKLEYEIIDAADFPLDSHKLPHRSLTNIVEIVEALPCTKALRIPIEGSLIHIAQSLRNAACRKGYKISLVVRGNFLYVGRG